MEQSFEILDDGEVTVPETKQAHGIAHIRDLMKADETPVAEIMKLIALEIVTVMSDAPNDILKRSQKEMNDRIKGLRELQKTLTEAELFSKRDALNFDGPKFRFVFGEIVRLFQESQTDAGVGHETVSSVMAHFRDKISSDEERIRRELKKMEGTK